MTDESVDRDSLRVLLDATDWTTEQARQVDWTAVEGSLGRSLPNDYKRLVERFGEGTFDDGYIDLHAPEDLPS
ncbi:hypothetical protein [Streptomyces fructofermentans]|nr:hypothetical protein [Streptomyces fructofermentans]